MRRRNLTLIALAVGLTTWISIVPLNAFAEQIEDDSTVQPVFGTYEYIGGQTQIAEMNRRIEKGVEELNVFIRGIAERRLREANHPTDKLTITSANGKIIVARSGKPDMAAPANGTVVDWKNPENKNELKVMHELKEGVLWQRIEGGRGSSVNRFVLAEDGQRLSVKTRIRVDRLENPIRFDTTYRRIAK